MHCLCNAFLLDFFANLPQYFLIMLFFHFAMKKSIINLTYVYIDELNKVLLCLNLNTHNTMLFSFSLKCNDGHYDQRFQFDIPWAVGYCSKKWALRALANCNLSFYTTFGVMISSSLSGLSAHFNTQYISLWQWCATSTFHTQDPCSRKVKVYLKVLPEYPYEK